MVSEDLVPPEEAAEEVPRALLTAREFAFVCVGAAGPRKPFPFPTQMYGWQLTSPS